MAAVEREAAEEAEQAEEAAEAAQQMEDEREAIAVAAAMASTVAEAIEAPAEAEDAEVAAEVVDLAGGDADGVVDLVVEEATAAAAAAATAAPILVLCQTNHALDQFLEGILRFEPRIVRVGGRSKSAALADVNLMNLLAAAREKRPALVKAARGGVLARCRRARGLVEGAAGRVDEAWGSALVSASMLSACADLLPDLGGALADGLRRLEADAIPGWLGGTPYEPLDIPLLVAAGGMRPDELRAASQRYWRDTPADAAEALLLRERSRLHNALLHAARERSSAQLQEALEESRRAAAALRELDDSESLEVLRSAAVVGMTTTGAAKYQSLVRRLGCRIIVMEEAAEVLEAHVLASLGDSAEQLLLIGDHQQLR